MAYDPTTASQPLDWNSDTTKAKTAKPQKRKGDSTKYVIVDERPVYAFPPNDAAAVVITPR